MVVIFVKAEKRKQIIAINRDKTLTPKERNLAIQKIMQHNYRESERVRKESEDLSAAGGGGAGADKTNESTSATTKTYHDKEKEILGCKHYQRKCKLVAKCCGQIYPCRFCHDDNADHKMDRYATEEVWCMGCEKKQVSCCFFCYTLI